MKDRFWGVVYTAGDTRGSDTHGNEKVIPPRRSWATIMVYEPQCKGGVQDRRTIALLFELHAHRVAE